jgi:mannose/fructose-specific phosphotransferase system component IIA
MEKTGDDEINKAIDGADRGCGVLVLTDIGGASPFNYVARLLPNDRVALVSGINLAMLIRVWNYRNRPLSQLVKLATDGAVRDIREHRR